MPKNQPELLDPDAQTNPAGVVNFACRFDDHDGRRFIQILGQCFYTYDLGDCLTERFIWVQLHQAGYAKMVEIAAATGIGLRSLQRWKKLAEQGGFEALLPKPIAGRPRAITATLKGQVLGLIDQGKSHEQIQTCLKLSGSSIDRIVAEDRARHQSAVQEHLQLEEEDCLVELPESQEAEPKSAPAPSSSVEPVAQSVVRSGEDAGAGSASEDPEGVRGQPAGDALDRSLDRTLAQLGMIDDATPLFAPGERLEGLGFFMAVALLSTHPVLQIFEKTYGKALAPAFYGLRTVVLTLLMMVLLRVKRPEQLRHHNPANQGRVLGLDRVMEVKTLRRKLHRLADLNRGVPLMEELGRARLEGQAAPAGGQLEILYLDGHVQCYHGGFKIGQTWSSTRNRTVKGRTDTWLHLPGQTPLFYLESPFNESLVKVIEKHREKIETLYAGQKPVLVFDREGWDVSFLNELDEKGWKFITYRKGNHEALPLETFDKKTTRIGKRSYAYAPVDIALQSFNLYEKTAGKSGKPVRRKIGQRGFREVRVLSDDAVKQTAVVTNLSVGQADAVTVCAALFQRWANQENVFKYYKQEYALDALLEYNRGEKSSAQRSAEEQVPGSLDHPNPEYVALTRRIGELAQKQTKLLARYGLVIENQAGSKHPAEIDADQLARLLKKIRASKHGRELRQIIAQLEELRVERAQCDLREEVAQAGYARLRSGIKQIVDAVKMSAYDLENQLFEMLAAHYPNRDKEGRKLIVSALRSAGSLRLEEGKILIKLEGQASPNRTRAIDAICRELNHRQATFPGTNMRIQFDTDRPA